MAEEEIIRGGTQGSGSHEEKILVSVRLRPLNEKEIARNDVSDWECINNNTIICKHSLPERSMFPSAYTFDRVFGFERTTKQVYEEGAKEVALAVLSGINSSIFAYGQTSSGKTYTMSGITAYAITDIFECVERRKDREFIMKFSAMEIYNEAVRDLLSSDSTPLRVLDDPERGTVVEKLTEETLRDQSHLEELLSICETQRQIGETSLNETSSRSHQILRLTIESSGSEYSGAENSSTLAATVNFVDLAGSERVSQTSSAGARLKEGCHINRSLLTLGTVIRKLSKGKNGHVPYRDSKLTRILQSSLGGNSRTAIICTMSPARIHVEQSRNTLFFASCAKEVTTNARVNLMVSDKALVKQLQRELARMESELRNLGSASIISDSAALLRDKEQLIEKMDKQIKELTWQRDLAHSRVENLLQSVGADQISKLDEYSVSSSLDVASPLHLDAELRTCNGANDFDEPIVRNSDKHSLELSQISEEDFLLDDSTPQFFGPDPCQGWEEIAQRTDEESEDICKEVRCIETEESSVHRKVEAGVFSPASEEKEENLSTTRAKNEDTVSSSQKGDRELSHNNTDYTYDALKEKVQEMQKTINYLASLHRLEQSPSSSEADFSSSGGLRLTRSRSCREALNISSPLWLDKAEQKEKTSPAVFGKDFTGRPIGFSRKFSELKYASSIGSLSRKDSQSSTGSMEAESTISMISTDAENMSNVHDFLAGLNEMAKLQSANAQNTKESGLENVSGTHDFFAGQNEVAKLQLENAQSTKESGVENISGGHGFVASLNDMDQLQSEKKLGDDSVQQEAPKTNKSSENIMDAATKPEQGAMQSHSSWPSEFERQQREIIELWAVCKVPLVHRTYFFLLFKGDPSDSVYMEVEFRRLSFLKNTFSQGTKTSRSSLKDLNREREMLIKQVQKKFSRKEREVLYQKWGIKLNTKQRSLQLAHRLWADTKDMDHIKESAALVAKLVGFIEPSHAPKEIFGLSFLPRSVNWRRPFSWKHTKSSVV